MREISRKRMSVLLIGNLLIGLGIAVFSKASMGIDPFTLMNKGISQAISVSFSIVQWSVGFAILVGVLFFDKKKIFIGTIMNMLLVAPTIQAFSVVIDMLGVGSDQLWVRLVLAVTGCTILSLGAGMYLATDLGMAPYDLIAIIIAEKKNWPFKWLRITTDSICVIIGFVLGSQVGVGTLIATFGMGPLIDLFKKKTELFLNKKKDSYHEGQVKEL